MDVTAGAFRARPFVGRQAEMSQLVAAFQDAAAGSGSFVVVAGSAGMGKSRLAGELASVTAERGARVLWGRCREGEGAPAYWPWAQILRSATTAGRETLSGMPERDVALIEQLLPGTDVPLDGTDPIDSVPRVYLFEAVTRFLASLAHGEPLVLIIEDLHRADRSSIRLLAYLAEEAAHERVMIVATMREEAAPSDVLIEGVSRARRLPLRGLSPESIAGVIDGSFGVRIDDETARAIHALTDGNPFHCDEVARLLHAEGRLESGALSGGDLRVPEGIVALVRRTLAPLSSPARDALAVAAVAGNEFPFAVLERCLGEDRERIVEALEEATERGLLAPAPLPFGVYSFAHAIVREALYDELPSVRRAALHGRVAAALEAIYGSAVGRNVAELAHHYRQALATGSEAKAIEYSARAGRQALTDLAYDEAVSHYEAALQLIALTTPEDDTRCVLLLGLGEARRRAGHDAGAREAFAEAAGIARVLGRADLLARAALGYGLGLGGQGFTFRVDATLVALLEEALAAVGESDPPLRVRLLCRLAVEMYFTDDVARRSAMVAEAMARAETIGDERLKLIALYSRQWALLTPDNMRDRLAAADEILRIAARLGDREMTYRGHHFRMMTLGVLGDDDGAMQAMRECERLAGELGMPLYRWHMTTCRAGLAIMAGDLAEAERLANEAVAVSQNAAGETAGIIYTAQLGVIAWLGGRLSDLEPHLKDLALAFPWVSVLRAAIVAIYGELGLEAETKREFERAAAEDFVDLRRDASWLHSMFFLALPCAFLGDTRRAQIMYDLLLPHAGETVLIGAMALNLGSASFSLGLLAATLQRWDDAIGFYTHAQRRSEAMGNKPFLAVALREHAAALLARNHAGDREQARDLLARSVATMREMGLQGFLGRAEDLAAEAGLGPGADAPEATLRFQDGAWIVGLGDRQSMLDDVKGLRYLRALIRDPGREHHVLDLVAAGADPDARIAGGAEMAASGLRPDDGGGEAMLDPQAKEAFKRRLQDLREEADEARAWNDEERAARAEAEIEAITAELTRSVGLGGRDRRVSSAAEKARLNVTRAIRSAIGRIAAVDSALADHLTGAVSTGVFCSYRPDGGEPLRWQI